MLTHVSPWRLQMILASGVVCSAVVSAVTGDLKQVSSDKYLAGKLLSDNPAHGQSLRPFLSLFYLT